MNRKSYEARERDLEAVKLYKEGHTFRYISAALGCSVGTAYNAVRTAFEESLRLSLEEANIIRQVELERLDDMFVPLFQKAKGGDIRAADTALRIMERRSKYLGLDMPDKLSVSNRFSINMLPAEELTDSQLEEIVMRGEAERELNKGEE